MLLGLSLGVRRLAQVAGDPLLAARGLLSVSRGGLGLGGVGFLALDAYEEVGDVSTHAVGLRARGRHTQIAPHHVERGLGVILLEQGAHRRERRVRLGPIDLLEEAVHPLEEFFRAHGALIDVVALGSCPEQALGLQEFAPGGDEQLRRERPLGESHAAGTVAGRERGLPELVARDRQDRRPGNREPAARLAGEHDCRVVE